MLKIDSHQHFWKFDPLAHAWINEEMTAIRKDFMPEDLYPLLRKSGLDGCISVQVNENETENNFMLTLANENNFIKGVIGWVDFLANDVEARLEYYTQFEIMRGFRYILQNKTPRDLMLNSAFKNSISLMAKHQFVYEILIFSDQLAYAKDLVAQFPNQIFVLNHLAKPRIKLGEIEQWRKDISALAVYENVYCKVSGMVTEADWQNWKYQDVEPYMDVAFNAFGTDRLMFGSDWPVCNLAANYQQVHEIPQKYINNLSLNEQEKFWGANAVKCYQIRQ